ncbi:MAG TPA: UDP-N-acetylglucosamine 4-epimerase [Chitinophagaceae bacterium]|nr:UDP-N-acetylglucosamine 4-epimerase [Chitinophagaceae bacterium]
MKGKVSIIGGSGFIGENLHHALQSEYEVCNIDKNQSSSFSTDIADVRNISELNAAIQNPDWIVLLAAEHKDNVSPFSLYYDVNVKGTENVLNLMREKNIRKIVFTSTVAVYGLNKTNPDENFPTEPFNDYGKSKLQAEELLRAWYNEAPQDRTLIIVRPTVVFGPKNKGNVYNLLQQILSGKFLMIGNGENKKSMAYVGNLVSFIHFSMNETKGTGYQLFNYADKPDLTTNQLVKIISQLSGTKLSQLRIPYFVGYLAGLTFDMMSKITGKEMAISSIRIKKFCATTQYSNKKVEEFNFKAPMTLQEGLNQTIKSLL